MKHYGYVFLIGHHLTHRARTRVPVVLTRFHALGVADPMAGQRILKYEVVKSMIFFSGSDRLSVINLKLIVLFALGTRQQYAMMSGI